MRKKWQLNIEVMQHLCHLMIKTGYLGEPGYPVAIVWNVVMDIPTIMLYCLANKCNATGALGSS